MFFTVFEMIILFKDVQSSNAFKGMDVNFFGNLIETNWQHSAKTQFPIDVMLSGKEIVFKELQPSKAYSPIVVRFFDITIEVNEVHPLKASLPIEVTLSDKITDFNELFKRYAQSLIDVKSSGKTKFSNLFILFSLSEETPSICSFCF